MLRRSGLRLCASTVGSSSLASPRNLVAGECSLYVMANGVAVVSINRPSRKNAIGRQLLAQLGECIQLCQRYRVGGSDTLTQYPDDIAASRVVRCVVVQSSLSDVFCAGADLKERKEMSPTEASAFVSTLRDTFSALEDLAVPTIAAIDGKALGGGLELALATDMRVAGEAATFGFPETGLAILPGAGGTQRAPRLIGVSRALEMILTAESISSPTALSLGLVNRAVPKGEAASEAIKIASRIAQNGPLGVVAAKAAVRNGYGKPRDEAMEAEREQYAKVLASQDRLEGLKAFAEKRPPCYKGC